MGISSRHIVGGSAKMLWGSGAKWQGKFLASNPSKTWAMANF